MRVQKGGECMKKILGTLISFCMMGFAVTPALAAPNNATNNPNIVANYSNGQHTVIEGGGITDFNHVGSDVVMKAGNSQNFQQWFQGTSTTETQDSTHGDHSVWRNVGSNTSCSSGWTLVVNPKQPPTGATWGSYFPNGDNYCVHTNDSH